MLLPGGCRRALWALMVAALPGGSMQQSGDEAHGWAWGEHSDAAGTELCVLSAWSAAPPACLTLCFCSLLIGEGKLENKMCILIYFVFRSGIHEAVLFFSYPMV